MSDAFPMPQTMSVPPRVARDIPDPPRDYAPKRGLAAVAEAISADPPPYKAPRHQDAIREALKKLTHREMRELVGAIYDANGGDTIARAELPDVLDKFAYGD